LFYYHARAILGANFNFAFERASRVRPFSSRLA